MKGLLISFNRVTANDVPGVGRSQFRARSIQILRTYRHRFGGRAGINVGKCHAFIKKPRTGRGFGEGPDQRIDHLVMSLALSGPMEKRLLF